MEDHYSSYVHVERHYREFEYKHTNGRLDRICGDMFDDSQPRVGNWP